MVAKSYTHSVNNLHTGRIVDETARVSVERNNGSRLQLDCGKDKMAMVELWSVRAPSKA